jgi:nitrile hydratase
MGGRFGDGPVVPEPEQPLFHEEWHKRALAVTVSIGSLGKWNIDVSRHARECLPPQDYAAFSYYEKWMGGLAALLVQTGVATTAELAQTSPAQTSDLAHRKLGADQVAGVLARGGPADRESAVAPHFAIGDAVITRRRAQNVLVEGGHTRLPAYAAGARGRILRYHGTHVLPDSNAHGLGEAPEPLYAVIFPASELWTHPEHPRDEVVLDLWQSYLEAV